MRIAVISDIHANLIAFHAVVNHMQEQKTDKIIFLGDLIMNGPHPKEVFYEIQRLIPDVWIKGNTDEWLHEIGVGFKPTTTREEYLYELFKYANERLSPQDRALLKSRPEKQILEVEDLRILCVHGSDRLNNEQVGIMTSPERFEQMMNELEVDIILCGHTHLSYLATYNKKRIVNPGSVSLSKDGDPKASYGILDIGADIVSYTNYRLSYDVQRVINDARIEGFPYIDIFIEKLSTAI